MMTQETEETNTDERKHDALIEIAKLTIEKINLTKNTADRLVKIEATIKELMLWWISKQEKAK